jgi:undecaprenyl pyrophosphate phosphatase UppP
LRQRPGASAVTGYIAVWGILKLVRNRSFAPFVLYRLVVGLAVLGLVATPIR